jgi:hypothetical protein
VRITRDRSGLSGWNGTATYTQRPATQDDPTNE